MTKYTHIYFITASMILAAACFLLVGIFIGYIYRDIKDRIAKLWEHQKSIVSASPPEVGVIPGAYHHVEEQVRQDNTKKTGTVIAKSPQLLEYEEQQRIRKLQGLSN